MVNTPIDLSIGRFGATLALVKVAYLSSTLEPHQERVADKALNTNLLIAHGMGSGKCVRGGTVILTDLGLQSIQSLFPDDLPGTEEAWIPSPRRVLSYVDGAYVWQALEWLYRQRLPDGESTVRISTKFGSTLDCTRQHPFLVLRNGDPTWVSAGLIKPGDWIATAQKVTCENHVTVSDRLVELVAWQVAEGHEPHADTAALSITQFNLDTLQRIQKLWRSEYPESESGHIRCSNRPHWRPTHIDLQHKVHKCALERLGYVWGRRSKDKQLPMAFMRLPTSQVVLLLRTLFDAEGSFERSSATLTSASHGLVLQVQYLLLRLGIKGHIHTAMKHATNTAVKVRRPYYVLALSGVNLRTFNRLVGSGYEYKREKLAVACAKPENVNYGIPIESLSLCLQDLGLLKAVTGTSLHRLSANEATAYKLVDQIRERVCEAVTGGIKKLGGSAGKWQQRTVGALCSNADLLLHHADKLEALLHTPLVFEPVCTVETGDTGGFVYDVSVAALEYGHRNYVAGVGGMIAHNTLSSIAIADRLKQPAEIFVPAPLVPNFQKEVQKHTGGQFVPYAVHSVPTAAQQSYDVAPGSTMIVDEAHLARNPEALRTKYLKDQARRAGRLVLLTGTPTYNQPENLAPLVNMLHGKTVLPEDPAEFRNRFIEERKVGPGILGWLLGVKPGVVKELKNRKELVKALKGKVDVFEQTKDMPERREQDVTVEMSPKQQNVYRYIEGSMPWYLRWKIRMDLPPSKQEAQSLNAFSAGLRQVSDTPGPYISGVSPERAGDLSPKLTAAAQSILEKSKKDPRFRGFVYSNYMDAGVSPMNALLHRAGISAAVFHGGLSKAQRRQLVDDYNSGKIKVLLGTSAATEGLDLKGTKLIQVLEPHFNESKTEQAIARGIRFGSHKHLPEAERNVLVERYYSKPYQNWLSRMIYGPQTGIDKYIRDRALEKDRLTQQIKDVLREAQG